MDNPAKVALKVKITHEGDLVAERSFREESDLWDIMGEFPPKQARGGVVVVWNPKRPEKVIVYAISGHSTKGPKWNRMA